MKNIHVLPTDKPIRLGYIFDNLILNSKLLSPTLYKNQNIYITNDEEIREGDWVLGDFPDNPIGKVISKYGQEFTAQSLNGDKYGLAEYDSKKIILTTDDQLIQNGIYNLKSKTMNNETKKDIKATIIMLIYIAVGIISGYFLEKQNTDISGVLAICGFVIGICVLGLLHSIWSLIRLEI
jgi:hypothetical protein